MERLTKRTCGVVVYVGAHENTTTGQIPCEVSAAGVREMMERLAAYEDTWLMPDEIKSMQGEHFTGLEMAKLHSALMELKKYQEADRDGRLVVLPCKVGDTVYFRTYDCNGTVDLGIQPHKVTAIVGHAIVRGGYTDVGLLPGQYGVSWFLTREEAEKALEATKNE